MTSLRTLLAGFVESEVPDIPISGLSFDSRKVQAGHLFVAYKGVHVDGHDYIAGAVERGAVAVLAERPVDCSVPLLRVDDARKTLGFLADRWYGEPSKRLKVIGVTGTNGKTTTSYIIHHLLKACGLNSSLLGTVCNVIAGKQVPARQTTADALTVHAAAAQTLEAGGQALVMEVSSHALDQDRVAGLRFDVAVFTNLSQDHLDYHGSMEAYRAAKAKLFEGLSEQAYAVLNALDPNTGRIARKTKAKVLRTGLKSQVTGPLDISAELGRVSLSGTELLTEFPSAERLRCLAPLVGQFNIENLLQALAAAYALGLDLDRCMQALAEFPGVPGRLQRISKGSQPAVFVDYAHTADALDRVLSTLRPLTKGRLRVVFGCGGDRDRSKRPEMARAVAKRADHITLTSDNPRSEDPQRIADDVSKGFGAHHFECVLDREAAIHKAVAEAEAGDLVLIAGKGHECQQIFADRVLHFDDREVAALALERFHPLQTKRSVA